MHIRLMKMADLPGISGDSPKTMNCFRMQSPASFPKVIPVRTVLPFGLEAHQLLQLENAEALPGMGVLHEHNQNLIHLSALQDKFTSEYNDAWYQQFGLTLPEFHWQTALQLIGEESVIFEPLNIFRVIQRVKESLASAAVTATATAPAPGAAPLTPATVVYSFDPLPGVHPALAVRQLTWNFLKQCTNILKWGLLNRPYLAGQIMGELGGFLPAEGQEDPRFELLDTFLKETELFKVLTGGSVISGAESKKRFIAGILIGASSVGATSLDGQLDFICRFAEAKIPADRRIFTLGLLKPFWEQGDNVLLGFDEAQKRSLQLSGVYVRRFFQPGENFWFNPANQALLDWFITEEADHRFKIGPNQKDYKSNPVSSSSGQPASYQTALTYICDGFDIFTWLAAREAFPGDLVRQADFINLVAHYIDAPRPPKAENPKPAAATPVGAQPGS